MFHRASSSSALARTSFSYRPTASPRSALTRANNSTARALFSSTVPLSAPSSLSVRPRKRSKSPRSSFTSVNITRSWSLNVVPYKANVGVELKGVRSG
eukprot:6007-Pelagococcus_subviridis.AAC.1